MNIAGKDWQLGDRFDDAKYKGIYSGNNDRISAADPSVAIGSVDFTFSVWVNVTNYSTFVYYPRIFSTGGGSGVDKFNLLFDNIVSAGRISLWNRDESLVIRSLTSVPLNQDTLLSVSKQSNVIRMHINGIFDNSVSSSVNFGADGWYTNHYPPDPTQDGGWSGKAWKYHLVVGTNIIPSGNYNPEDIDYDHNNTKVYLPFVKPSDWNVDQGGSTFKIKNVAGTVDGILHGVTNINGFYEQI